MDPIGSFVVSYIVLIQLIPLAIFTLFLIRILFLDAGGNFNSYKSNDKSPIEQEVSNIYHLRNLIMFK
jgi:hypothetical protein